MPLSNFADKPILVVNTAGLRLCGAVRWVQGLWTRFGSRGLMVIAVPSPDFGNQER